MSNVVCFYHSRDLDGHCSGAIVRAYEKELTDRDVKCVGIDYGYDESTIFDNVAEKDTVYVVDFTFKVEDFVKLQEMGCEIIWIDHHASKIDDPQYAQIDIKLRGVRLVGRAACELAWNYLFGGETPEVVKQVGAWDLWKFDDPITKPFYAGLNLMATEPEDDLAFEDGWMVLFNEKPEWTSETPSEVYVNILNLGSVVLEQEYRVAERAMKKSYDAMFHGHKFLVCCGQFKSSEDFVSALRDDHDGILWYYWDGKRWKFSLRSEKIDVAAIATKYEGGGGHKAAAGFHTVDMPSEVLAALEKKVVENDVQRD